VKRTPPSRNNKAQISAAEDADQFVYQPAAVLEIEQIVCVVDHDEMIEPRASLREQVPPNSSVRSRD
jgi:hypothetical protein